MDETMLAKRRAGADPLRLKLYEILMTSEVDWTAKELAAQLGTKANGLYYHLRIMEESGLIAEAGSRAVGRFAERTYRATADYKVTWDLSQPVDMSLHFQAILEVAKGDVDDALFDAARHIEAGEEPPTVMVEAPSFDTTSAEIVEFLHRLRALRQEFRERAAERQGDAPPPADWKTLKFTYALRERPLRQRVPTPSTAP